MTRLHCKNYWHDMNIYIHESEIGGKDALAEPNRELKSVSVSFRVRVVRASERARRSCTLCGRCGRGVFVNAGQ